MRREREEVRIEWFRIGEIVPAGFGAGNQRAVKEQRMTPKGSYFNGWVVEQRMTPKGSYIKAQGKRSAALGLTFMQGPEP